MRRVWAGQMVRAQLFSAAAVAAFCFGASSSPPTGLEPNNVEEPNEVRNASHVCDGRTHRSQECSVLLDVPIACAAPGKMSTPCPIVFFLHDAQQTGKVFAKGKDSVSVYVHNEGVIGVYPTADGGWNSYGDLPNDACKWNEYSCTKDNDERKFIAAIVSLLGEFGAHGRIYAYGEGEGAGLAQKLAANSDASLPIAGIWAASMQLLASPAQAGPGEHNYNQPSTKRGSLPVAQAASHGTADALAPWKGGKSPLHKTCAPCSLMSEPKSAETWARHNGCTGNATNKTFHATWGPDGAPTTAVHYIWEYALPPSVAA